jgi:hypothetical protein
MDNEGVLEGARAIRPYLSDLVGPTADRLDRRIAELLATAALGKNVVDALRSLLESHEATGSFVAEVLVDAPHYRPPYLQPGYLRSRGLQPLAGDVGPVLHAGKFACLHGDYVWYRPAIGTPIPPCPTHGLSLTRT